jgi:hypothetical protein
MKALSLVGTSTLTVFVAYIAAIAIYAGVDWLVRIPSGSLWSDVSVLTMRTILIMLVLCVLILPVLRGDGDPTVRTVCAISALTVLAYTVLKTTGLGDPDIPQVWLVHHALEPLRRMSSG